MERFNESYIHWDRPFALYGWMDNFLSFEQEILSCWKNLKETTWSCWENQREKTSSCWKN